MSEKKRITRRRVLQAAMAGTSSVIGGKILQAREPDMGSPASRGGADPRIQGPFLILSTPFTASGAVDFDVLAKQARYVD